MIWLRLAWAAILAALPVVARALGFLLLILALAALLAWRWR